MRKNLLILSMLMAYLACSGALESVQAKEENGVASALCDYGKQLLKRGETENAIHEFSKALIVDPENETAKSYLSKFGMQEGLYSGERTDRSRVVELVRDLRRLKQNIVVENEMSLLADNSDPNEVRKIIIPARQDPFAKAPAEGVVQTALAVTESDPEDALDSSYRSSRSAMDNSKIYETTEELKAREMKLCPKKAGHEGHAMSEDVSGALVVKDGEIALLTDTTVSPQLIEPKSELSLDDYLKLIRKKDHCIAELKDALASSLKELILLQRAKTAPVPEGMSADAALEDRVSAAQKLLEQDVIIKEKEQNVSELKAKVADVEERLGLSQRLIDEKDGQIQALAEEIKKMLDEKQK